MVQTEKGDIERFARVVSHFDLTDEKYINRNSIIIPFIIGIILSLARKKSQILEVGCGGGLFLREIQSKREISSSILGLDISRQLLRYASNSRRWVDVVRASAHRIPLQTTFDFVVAVNLFHHLVAKSRRNSLRNAKIALKEMIRVATNKGYIILSEGPIVASKSLSSLIFWGTTVLSLLGVSIPEIGIKRNLIVNFLTSKELLKMLGDLENEKQVKLMSAYAKTDNALISRLIGSKNLILVVRKVF